jgi:hypothetical protein
MVCVENTEKKGIYAIYGGIVPPPVSPLLASRGTTFVLLWVMLLMVIQQAFEPWLVTYLAITGPILTGALIMRFLWAHWGEEDWLVGKGSFVLRQTCLSCTVNGGIPEDRGVFGMSGETAHLAIGSGARTYIAHTGNGENTLEAATLLSEITGFPVTRQRVTPLLAP